MLHWRKRTPSLYITKHVYVICICLLPLLLGSCATQSKPAQQAASNVNIQDPDLNDRLKWGRTFYYVISRLKSEAYQKVGSCDLTHAIVLELLSMDLATLPRDTISPDQSSVGKTEKECDDLLFETMLFFARNLSVDDYRYMIESAIRAAVKFVGNDSLYLAPDEARVLESFPGFAIGVRLRKSPHGPIVDSVVKSGSAYRHGIVSGDRIIAVDDIPSSGKSMNEVVELLRSDHPSTVEVRVEHLNGKQQTFFLRREKTIDPGVEYELLQSNIGYIRIFSFSRSAKRWVSAAMRFMRYDEELKGLIVDLRGCTGGVLKGIIEVSDLFLDKGRIVESKFREPIKSEIHNAQASAEGSIHLPLAILVDRQTSSGAIAMAAAMQDNKRAVVVGQPTSKTAALFTYYSLPNKGALKLYSGELVRPDGRYINQVGVTPDIGLPENMPESKAIEIAREILKLSPSANLDDLQLSWQQVKSIQKIE
jgi:carboxyl-terminal processing protease